MISRRDLITAVGLALTTPLAASAEQPTKAYRVGILASVMSPPIEAFKQGLRDLGYVEGRNVSIELRLSGGRNERFPDLAAELLRLPVDLIVSSGDAADAAKKATRTIPIVFAGHGDPVGTGLVTSLARPGGNVTGLSLQVLELGVKRLELLKETIAGLSRVAALWPPGFDAKALKVAEDAARAVGLKYQVEEVRGPEDFERAIQAAAKWQAGALQVAPTGLTFAHRARIADLAVRNRLPAMSAFREFAEAGGLMVYGASISDVWRRAATYVDKILKGAKPGDLPVEQPTKFELVINLKTAKALGLRIPQSLLVRADELIE